MLPPVKVPTRYRGTVVGTFEPLNKSTTSNSDVVGTSNLLSFPQVLFSRVNYHWLHVGIPRCTCEQCCGLRPSVLGQDRSETGLGLGLAGPVLCCVKHGLVTLVVVMILKVTATFQVLFTVSPYRAWNFTTVKINSGVHLLKSQIRQMPLFTSGLGLGLLRIWSCLHHCLCVCVIVWSSMWPRGRRRRGRKR